MREFVGLDGRLNRDRSMRSFPQPAPLTRFFAFGAQYDRAHQIVGDHVPQNHRFGFEQTAHVELVQAAVAGDGVDALRRRRTLLIDLFGRVGSHPLSPGSDLR